MFVCIIIIFKEHKLTHGPLGDVVISKWNLQTCYGLDSWALVKLLSDECHYRTPKMIGQHSFRWWLGAIRQQAITWANVDPKLWRHMASVGHNELTSQHILGDWFSIGWPRCHIEANTWRQSFCKWQVQFMHFACMEKIKFWRKIYFNGV